MLAALRLVFNATALLALLALAAAAGVVALHGQDLPWGNLALGRMLAEGGSIPRFEGILFSAPGAAFDARCWAWDWTAWQAFKIYGESALRLADAAAWLLAAWALAAAAFRRGARPFSTALFCAWALLASRPDLAPGPGLAAYTAFCAALWIMEGDFWTSFFGRWIWLGPLAVVAVNLSPAAWFLAPLVFLWMLSERGESGPPRQPAFAKAAFFMLLLVCLCLHPQGPAALKHVAHAWSDSPLLPGAFAPRQAALLQGVAMAVLLVASSWTAPGKARFGRDAAVLAGFGAAALLNRGALPFLLAAAAPAAAARFDILVDALPRALRALRWPAKVAALGLAAVFVLKGGLGPGPAPASLKPAQTADFYESELLNANILCPAEWTPALAFKLSPNARFGLDARGVSDPARAAELEALLRAEGDVAGGLRREGVELCWLKRGSPLALALATSQAWQPVCFDDASVLYLPTIPANADLIKTHAPRGLRPGDPQEPFDPTRMAQAEADLEAGLAHDPGLGVLYLYMSQLWLARGHEAKARETLEGGIRADPGFAPNFARLASLRAALGDAADVDAARTLYRRALWLQEDADWRRALAALGPA